jgi:glycosyltransferase involved in cell wall biosynthesis
VVALNVLWLIDHVCYDGSLHGGGRLYSNLAPAFVDDQVRVFPYFLRASAEVQRIFEASPVNVTTLGKGKYDPTTVLTVLGLCKKHQVDVMHLFCYASSTVGRIAGAVTGIPTIIHDFDTQIYFPYPLYLRVLDRVLASSTGHALAASPMCREYMRDRRGVPAGRIEVMPHAIPASRFQKVQQLDRAGARGALGWSREHIVFCTLTKLGPDRGNEYLLRAFARVAAKRPDVRLVVVYKPTDFHRVPKEYEDVEWIRDTARIARDLEFLAAELRIADRVEFVESLDQPDLYFAGSDVLVVPFLHERFSSVHLLEGFAHGRPAIATDLGEQRELMRDGEHGVLVPPGDEEALAEAMLTLADNDEAREAMGRACAVLARRFSVTASADRLTTLYRALAARQTAGLARVEANA